MTTVAVTYTWVVEVDDESQVPEAVEEYVHSVSDAFDNPVKIEKLAGEQSYTIHVSNSFDAVSPEDAVKQMVAWLSDYAYSAGYRVEWGADGTEFIDAERLDLS